MGGKKDERVRGDSAWWRATARTARTAIIVHRPHEGVAQISKSVDSAGCGEFVRSLTHREARLLLAATAAPHAYDMIRYSTEDASGKARLQAASGETGNAFNGAPEYYILNLIDRCRFAANSPQHRQGALSLSPLSVATRRTES